MVEMSNRPWWTRKLAPHDVARIERAIADAERKTTAEIVPVLARRSSACSSVFFVLALQLFATVSILLYGVEAWRQEPLPFEVILLATIGGVILAWSIATQSWAFRWVVPADDRDYQCNLRALGEFHRLGLTSTRGRTGVLLFVSTDDHRAVVLADEAIAKLLPPETWQRVVDKLLAHIKKGRYAEGFCEAIGMTGEILKDHFPATVTDKNELRNHLILVPES
jgi:putative membrane protein